MSNHEHQFLEIEKVEISKPMQAGRDPIGMRFDTMKGVKGACMICGLVRSVFEDGSIVTHDIGTIGV